MSERVHGSARIGVLVAVGLLLSGEPALGRTELTAGGGLLYSDNINQSSQNEQDDWVAIGMVGVSHEEEGRERVVSLDGIMQYRNYLDGTYSDEVIGALDANATFKVRPEQLHWIVRDYYTQAVTDPFAAETPDNREGVNVFSTGPDLIFQLGATTRAEIGGRFEHHYFEDSDADSIRFGAHAGIERASTPTRTLLARYQIMDVDYDNGISDMLRHDAVVGVRQRLANGALTVEGGYTDIERDTAQDVDGARGRAELTWDVTDRTGFRVAASGQYTDEGSQLLEGSIRDGSTLLVDEQVTGDIYYSRLGEVRLFHNAPAMDITLRGAFEEEEYEVLVVRDREVTSAGINVTRRMRPQLTGLLFADFRRVEYLNVTRDDDDSVLGVALDYEVARNWFTGLSFRRDERDSTEPGFDFTENRVLFTIRYGDQFREDSFNAP